MPKVDLSGGVTVILEHLPDPKPETEKSEPDKDPEKEGRVAVAGALATGMTVLVATVGIFGGLTGAVARMARNDPWWTGIAIAAVVVSVALAITARLVAPGKGTKKISIPKVSDIQRPHWSTAMLWASAALFAFGVIVATVNLTTTIGKDDRPGVSAQITREATTGVASIAGTARAGGLATEDAIRVVVVAFAEGETKEGTLLYFAGVGPNSDGVVEHSFTVILPSDARSVLITAGKDSGTESEVPGTCQPETSVDEPVDPADPVEVEVPSGEEDGGPLSACVLVAVPAAPPPTLATGAGDAANGDP